jgi:hypothetical protein
MRRCVALCALLPWRIWRILVWSLPLPWQSAQLRFLPIVSISSKIRRSICSSSSVWVGRRSGVDAWACSWQVLLLIPSLATVWKAWEKFLHPVPPDPVWLAVAGVGALAVNLACALVLARHRQHQGSLVKAAFFSARNDALANVAIVVAGIVTTLVLSGWPDLIVGLGILVINADAARKVWIAARHEVRLAEETGR